MVSVLTPGQALLVLGVVLSELWIGRRYVEARGTVAEVLATRGTALLFHGLLMSPYIFGRPDLLLGLAVIHVLLFAGEAAGRLTAHRLTRCVVWAGGATGVTAWAVNRFPLEGVPPLIAVPAGALGVSGEALSAVVCLAAVGLVTTHGGTVVARAVLDDLDWPAGAGGEQTAARHTAQQSSPAGVDGGEDEAREDTAAGEVAAAAARAQASSRTADPHAGRLIGHLERLLVVLLGAYGEFGAIGFVIAAKSIARFEALKHRPFAEYYLTGTLASLTAAAGAVFLVRFLFIGV